MKPSFVDTREMRKASPHEVLSAIQYMSDFLAKKTLDSPEMDDIESIAYKHMAGDVYENYDNMDEIFILNDILIGIPSLKPQINYNNGSRKNGVNVVPLVHIPGKKPVYAWDSKGDTYKEKYDLSLRGGRSMTIHNVIPGMMVSFHFFENDNGIRTRREIRAKKIIYSDNGHLDIIDVPESEASVRMPDWD